MAQDFKEIFSYRLNNKAEFIAAVSNIGVYLLTKKIPVLENDGTTSTVFAKGGIYFSDKEQLVRALDNLQDTLRHEDN